MLQDPVQLFAGKFIQFKLQLVDHFLARGALVVGALEHYHGLTRSPRTRQVRSSPT
jgi:hypothetical protein